MGKLRMDRGEKVSEQFWGTQRGLREQRTGLGGFVSVTAQGELLPPGRGWGDCVESSRNSICVSPVLRAAAQVSGLGGSLPHSGWGG